MDNPDFLYTDYGSMIVLTPLTDEARDFKKKNLQFEDWQQNPEEKGIKKSETLAIDARCWPEIRLAIEIEGMKMEEA